MEQINAYKLTNSGVKRFYLFGRTEFINYKYKDIYEGLDTDWNCNVNVFIWTIQNNVFTLNRTMAKI